MWFMTNFKIGFKINKSLLQKPSLSKNRKDRWDWNFNYDVKDSDGLTVYLQGSGDYYKLLTIYNLTVNAYRKSHPPVVCSFNIPNEIPIGFDIDTLTKHYKVELLDVLDSSPIHLKSYLERGTANSQATMKPEKHAIIRGFTYGIFSVMNDIRDNIYEDPIKLADNYENICRSYGLPAIIPYIPIR